MSSDSALGLAPRPVAPLPRYATFRSDSAADLYATPPSPSSGTTVRPPLPTGAPPPAPTSSSVLSPRISFTPSSRPPIPSGQPPPPPGPHPSAAKERRDYYDENSDDENTIIASGTLPRVSVSVASAHAALASSDEDCESTEPRDRSSYSLITTPSNNIKRSSTTNTTSTLAVPGASSSSSLALPTGAPLKHIRRKSALNMFSAALVDTAIVEVVSTDAAKVEGVAIAAIEAAPVQLGGISDHVDGAAAVAAEAADVVPDAAMPVFSLPTSPHERVLRPSQHSASAADVSGAPHSSHPMFARRGSDFRLRLNVNGSSSLSHGHSIGSLLTPSSTSSCPSTPPSTKSQCLFLGCTSFQVRFSYCLRHVWRLSLPEIEPVNSAAYSVAREMVSSERSYAEGLRVLAKGFVGRIQCQVEMETAALSHHSAATPGSASSSATHTTLIDPHEIATIFHNILELSKLSDQLLVDLEEILVERVLLAQIGTTLLHYAPRFRIYQTYLENYDDSAKMLAKVRREKPEFDFFCKIQEKCEGMSLQSFLIMPVQRLPRYLLLLAELIKRSDPDPVVIAPVTPSSVPLPSSFTPMSDLHAARDRIGIIARSINSSLHAKESSLKVRSIEKSFERDSRFQPLVTPTRYLIREGPLKKRYGKGTRHLSSSTVYHFFLFNDIFVYADFTRNVLGRGTTYRMKHLLPLSDMVVVACSSGTRDKNKDIAVSTKSDGESKRFELSCVDTNDRDSWIADIQKAIDTLKEESMDYSNDGTFDGNTRTSSGAGTAGAGTTSDKAKLSKINQLMGK